MFDFVFIHFATLNLLLCTEAELITPLVTWALADVQGLMLALGCGLLFQAASDVLARLVIPGHEPRPAHPRWSAHGCLLVMFGLAL